MKPALSWVLSFPKIILSSFKRFGAAIVGSYPIFGLRAVDPMGTFWSVVQVNFEEFLNVHCLPQM